MMSYNMWPDLLILGGFITALITVIMTASKKPTPYVRYNMVDQSKRWGK
jgi:hypothetical protein